MKTVLVLTAVLACVAGAVRAGADESAVPEGFAYQGVLSDPVTGPLTGEQTVTFRLFDDVSGGVPLWETNQVVVCSPEGLFHAWLEEGGEEMTESFLKGGDGPFERYLELEVEGHGGAIAPRVEFTSVPQVLLARSARQSVTGFRVQGDLRVATNGLLQVAATNRFAGGASFATLDVGGDAKWTGNASPLEVNGTVEAEKMAVPGLAPVGSIAMWTGTNAIPEGWAPCDGEIHNGIRTPDLQDRFLVGVGDDRQGNVYAAGDTGGTNEVVLGMAQMPAHAHAYWMPSMNDDRSAIPHSGDVLVINYDQLLPPGYDDTDSDTTDSACGDPESEQHEAKAHENRPPYHAVCFIMRVE